MALVKVTAYKWVTVIDPFPMEGVGHVTIQLQPGQYQAYHMYDHQADRLIEPLDNAKAAGMLDYEIEWDDCCSINNKRYAQISFNDVVPGGKVLLGVVPSGAAVSETALVINSTFDGGTAMTVGDSVGQARLLAQADNKPNKLGDYKRDNDYRYTADTNIYVYFPAGTPTTGSAEIFVYLA